MKRNAHRNWYFALKKSYYIIVRMPVSHSLLFFNHIVQLIYILIQKISFPAALLYYTDERTKTQASCLLAQLVFSDVITHASTDQQENEAIRVRRRTKRNFLSVPALVTLNIHLPFVCESRPWKEEAGLCAEMRAVYQLLQEGDAETLEFFRAVWASGRSPRGVEHTIPDEQSQNDLNFSASLQMSQAEVDILKSYMVKLVLDSLLKNIENATSHQDVKSNATTLRFYIQQVV